MKFLNDLLPLQHDTNLLLMKIALIVIGKTDAAYFAEGINEYKCRLSHYIPFTMEVISDIKNAKSLNESQQKEKEGELILKALLPGDYVVLLDEGGKEFTSMVFHFHLVAANIRIADTFIDVDACVFACIPVDKSR